MMLLSLKTCAIVAVMGSGGGTNALAPSERGRTTRTPASRMPRCVDAATVDGGATGHKSRREVLEDAVRLGGSTVGAAFLPGAFACGCAACRPSPASALAQLKDQSDPQLQEALETFGQRDKVQDAAFACGMSTGMADYGAS